LEESDVALATAFAYAAENLNYLGTHFVVVTSASPEIYFVMLDMLGISAR